MSNRTSSESQVIAPSAPFETETGCLETDPLSNKRSLEEVRMEINNTVSHILIFYYFYFKVNIELRAKIQKLENENSDFQRKIHDLESDALKREEELSKLSILLGEKEDEVMDLKEKMEESQPITLTISNSFILKEFFLLIKINVILLIFRF